MFHATRPAGKAMTSRAQRLRQDLRIQDMPLTHARQEKDKRMRQLSTALTSLSPTDTVTEWISKKEAEWLKTASYGPEFEERLDRKILPNLIQQAEAGDRWSESNVHNMGRVVSELFVAHKEQLSAHNKSCYFSFAPDGSPVPELNDLCIEAETLNALGMDVTDDQLKALSGRVFEYATKIAAGHSSLPRKKWSIRIFQFNELQNLAKLRSELVMAQQKISRQINAIEFFSLSSIDKAKLENVLLLSPTWKQPSSLRRISPEAGARISFDDLGTEHLGAGDPLMDEAPEQEQEEHPRANTYKASDFVYTSRGDRHGYTAAAPQIATKRPAVMFHTSLDNTARRIDYGDLHDVDLTTPPAKRRSTEQLHRPAKSSQEFITIEELATIDAPWARSILEAREPAKLQPLQKLLKGEQSGLPTGLAALHHLFSKETNTATEDKKSSTAKSSHAPYTSFTKRAEDTLTLLRREEHRIKDTLDQLRIVTPPAEFAHRVNATIARFGECYKNIRMELVEYEHMLQDVRNTFISKIRHLQEEGRIYVWTAISHKGEKAAESVETDGGAALKRLLTSLHLVSAETLVEEGKGITDPMTDVFQSVNTTTLPPPAPASTTSQKQPYKQGSNTPRPKGSRDRDDVPGTATWPEGFPRMAWTHGPCLNCRQNPPHRVEDCPNPLTNRIDNSALRRKVGANIKEFKATPATYVAPALPKP